MTTYQASPAAVAVGTANWSTTTESQAMQDKVLIAMREHGVTLIDTSRRYGGGASETTLGQKGIPSEFTITTKAAKVQPGGGGGKKEHVLNDAKQSFEALKIDKVAVYLLHIPDETVPIVETYSAIQALYLEGRFKEFGISNFSTEQVLECYEVGKANNYVLPTVYQGAYSAATRLPETTFFPTLRLLS